MSGTTEGTKKAAATRGHDSMSEAGRKGGQHSQGSQSTGQEEGMGDTNQLNKGYSEGGQSTGQGAGSSNQSNKVYGDKGQKESQYSPGKESGEDGDNRTIQTGDYNEGSQRGRQNDNATQRQSHNKTQEND